MGPQTFLAGFFVGYSQSKVNYILFWERAEYGHLQAVRSPLTYRTISHRRVVQRLLGVVLPDCGC